jgi:hypothetical protein
MTEQEWVACTDPGPMLAWLTGAPGSGPQNATGVLAPTAPPSGRKLRLFACACIRLGLRHEVYRHRVGAVLRSTGAAEAAVDGGPRHTILGRDPALAARTEMEIVLALHSGLGGPLAGLLRDVVGNPFRPVAVVAGGFVHWRVGPGAVSVSPPWLTPAVRGIARRAYDLRDWEALPVLADALQEAGCEDEDVLMHCRGKGRCPGCLGKGGCCNLKDEPGVWGEMHRCALCAGTGWVDAGPHVRGCHVLDLIIGKE